MHGYSIRNCLFSRYGTVQHEMLHALGFFHEQSRTDRNDFVTINLDNVEEGKIDRKSRFVSRDV